MGLEQISIVVEPQGALTCRSSTITVWADSGPFLGLLLYFGVTELFPLLTNPGVRLCIVHKKILGLSDSGLFHGLLLTILGSQSDFHGCRTPRCAYVLVINNLSFGRFWPVSWTITQFWGNVVISTTNEHRCVYVSVINTRILANSGPFHGLLLTVLGSRSDFDD